MFKLHATLLWTILDFLTYTNLSRWSTKGEKACSICRLNTRSYWLTHSSKYCCMGTVGFYFLIISFKKTVSFDSRNREWAEAPTRLSRSEMRRQLDDILTEYKVEDLIKRRWTK